MKILNLYAGIGGNRKYWGDEHEITAVEINREIASIYSFIYLPKNLLLKGLQVQKQSIREFEFTDFCKTIWSKLVLYIYIQVIFRTNQSS